MEYITDQIPFLDILIKKNQNGIWMDLYHKPIDTQRCLPFTSSHPKHCERNIPFCLAWRISIIAGNNADKLKNLENLKSNLSDRVRLSRSWFMIHDKVLNFHDWILCYGESSHDKRKRWKSTELSMDQWHLACWLCSDTQRCLPFTSSHPNHCKRNIPFCLAWRISITAENNAEKLENLENSKSNLSKYYYPDSLIKQGF